MIVSLVVAVAENGVIGKDGGLPWRLPDDLKRFKAITAGHAVLMGRVTHESIGRPLPGRQNIVISSRPEAAAPGCETAPSLERGLALVKRRDECFVIGGARLYREALPLAHRIHLTRVHAALPGDVRFPEFDLALWREVARESHPADADHAYSFDFVTLERG